MAWAPETLADGSTGGGTTTIPSTAHRTARPSPAGRRANCEPGDGPGGPRDGPRGRRSRPAASPRALRFRRLDDLQQRAIRPQVDARPWPGATVKHRHPGRAHRAWLAQLTAQRVLDELAERTAPLSSDGLRRREEPVVDRHRGAHLIRIRASAASTLGPPTLGPQPSTVDARGAAAAAPLAGAYRNDPVKTFVRSFTSPPLARTNS